jgi:SAM-dependent methyltransferase
MSAGVAAVGSSTHGPVLTDALRARLVDVYGPDRAARVARRFEDPAFLRAQLHTLVAAHLPPDRLDGASVLDFGCGTGASLLHLAQMFPSARYVGVELQADYVAVAEAVFAHFGLRHVQALVSPRPDALPEGIGPFDVIVCNAVVEHLLPGERASLLPMLWRALRPGGVLLLTETPWRWFPKELHTTGLWGINWMPAALAGPYARAMSRRPGIREADWAELLRRGIRGTTVAEITSLLRASGDGEPRVLAPTGLGHRDHVDLWLGRTGGKGRTPRKAIAARVARLATPVFGEPMVPTLTLGLEKLAPTSS